MMERLNRRDFLKGAVLLGGAYLLGKMPEKRPSFEFFSNDRYILYKNLAKEMDSYLDKIPPRIIVPDEKTIENWVSEVLPMFEYEDMVFYSVKPDEVSLTKYADARKHTHVLGRSDCQGEIELNFRLANPASPYRERPLFLPVLIHELTHIQQQELCYDERWRGEVEKTAQIVTLEILASLSNQGNKDATYALLDTLRGMALSSAWSVALKEGKEDDFISFKHSLSDAYETSRFEKARRYWKDAPFELMRILREYNEEPLSEVLKAAATRERIYGLAIRRGALSRDGYNIPYFDRGFEVDDITYFLFNVKDIVKEL